MYLKNTGMLNVITRTNNGDNMLKLNFTKTELQQLKDKIFLSEIQERIIEYRLKEYSRVKMAQLESVSIQTIDREINKIAQKIYKVI